MPGKKRPRRERIHHQSHRANPVLSWCKQPRCSEPVNERRSPRDEKRGGARVLIVPLAHAWLLRREAVHEALY